MCCSQVLLKESSSREEERAAFLTGSGREHTLVGGTSLVVLPWRLENLSDMLRNLAPEGQVAGIRFIDKVFKRLI